MASLLVDIIVLAAIWILPWLPLLHKQEGWAVPLRESFARPPLLPCVASLCSAVAVLYTARLLGGLGNTIVFFSPVMVVLSLKAGILEELAFRGLLFNYQSKQIGIQRSALVNGALFALYHYPQAIFGMYGEITVSRMVLLFVMGVLFSLSFAKWRSLTMNMIVHASWNFFSYMFALSA